MVMPPPDDGDPRWRLDLAGGGLMDVGCYGLHALRMLGAALGGAPRLRGRPGRGARPGRRRLARRRAGTPGRRPGDDAQRDDRAGVRLQLPAGRVARGRRSRRSSPARTWTTGSRSPARTATRVEELGRRSSYTYQLEALAAHLRDGAPLVTDADDAVANMELIDEVYRAAGLAPRPRHAAVRPAADPRWAAGPPPAVSGHLIRSCGAHRGRVLDACRTASLVRRESRVPARRVASYASLRPARSDGGRAGMTER